MVRIEVDWKVVSERVSLAGKTAQTAFTKVRVRERGQKLFSWLMQLPQRTGAWIDKAESALQAIPQHDRVKKVEEALERFSTSEKLQKGRFALKVAGTTLLIAGLVLGIVLINMRLNSPYTLTVENVVFFIVALVIIGALLWGLSNVFSSH